MVPPPQRPVSTRGCSENAITRRGANMSEEKQYETSVAPFSAVVEALEGSKRGRLLRQRVCDESVVVGTGHRWTYELRCERGHYAGGIAKG